MNIASYIDHTVLAADATRERIEKLCAEAKQWHFASVCVNTCWTAFCADQLKGSGVNVCSVVGFPLGAMSTRAKAFEAKAAVDDGADEIDMVINIGWLKDGRDDLVENDIREVKCACGDKHLKVIIETCLLTEEEKVRACKLSVKAGADFVKTSTGFSTGGAKAEDVALMRKTVGPEIGVKASGGIRTYEDAKKMIDAGANRLGCSAGIAIVTSAK
jgi:deoxyribose-phosphate aldolase